MADDHKPHTTTHTTTHYAACYTHSASRIHQYSGRWARRGTAVRGAKSPLVGGFAEQRCSIGTSPRTEILLYADTKRSNSRRRTTEHTTARGLPTDHRTKHVSCVIRPPLDSLRARVCTDIIACWGMNAGIRCPMDHLESDGYNMKFPLRSSKM